MRFPAQDSGRRRKSQVASFPAPVAGWISNRSLATPREQQVQGAAILDNWFPTATSIVMRRGSEVRCIIGADEEDEEFVPPDVDALFTYSLGSFERMFAANATTIYDVSNPADPVVMMDGLNGGDWSVVQFATAGGTFLIGVNGTDPGFVYDGTAFYPQSEGGIVKLPFDAQTTPFQVGETVTGGTSGADGTVWKIEPRTLPGTGFLYLTGVDDGPFQDNEALTGLEGGGATVEGAQITVPGTDVSFDGSQGDGLTTANLSYVWAYKERLWFIQKDSLDAWYLDVDQIAGELTWFPLGGVFNRGGSLLFGATWSLDSGGDGGLSEQCIFVTTNGDVAVYQGISPEDAASWGKVGVYRIGAPLGKHAHYRAGADIHIATNIGLIPLSQAIQREFAVIAPAAISSPIEVAWNDAVARRQPPWHCEIWPEGQMVIVAPTSSEEEQDFVFAVNASTSAWARFTNWTVRCLCVYQGGLYFGSTGGKVVQAMVTGTDQDQAYTAKVLPLFDDLGAPLSRKVAKMAKITVRAASRIDTLTACRFDFDMSLPAPPAASIPPAGDRWGTAVWGEAVWGGTVDKITMDLRVSISGYGYRIAPSVQVTSGAPAPIDVEIVSSEVSYEVADVFT